MVEMVAIVAVIAAVMVAVSRGSSRGAVDEETTDSVTLYLRFVRNAGVRKLATLPEVELLKLGMATCESLREYDGDVDMTLLAAISAGADLDFVLPVVVGAGFFLCPEYREDVQRAGLMSGPLFRH